MLDIAPIKDTAVVADPVLGGHVDSERSHGGQVGQDGELEREGGDCGCNLTSSLGGRVL